ncbi:hypothetical protein [Sediminitomix flava]|uniref:Uncharacterized protein n=1 Tax=Sediminitomix flava TaxID=379075 RepID=A0A315Z898_SEDFL|nr:hypothetical protein [Sediminitomix flava]PWJ41087.1 hypothetical protein BC781_104362 [Sediminitomix flava]
MVDGVTLKFKDGGEIANYWRSCLRLPFNVITNWNTGEIYPYMWGEYKGLRLGIFEHSDGVFKYVIRGSLHVFWNNGGANDTLYTFQDFLKTLDKLEKELCVNAQSVRVHSVEFGLNVSTSLDASFVLTGLKSWGKDLFSLEKEDAEKKTIKAIKKDDYEVKIYDKGGCVANQQNQRLNNKKQRKQDKRNNKDKTRETRDYNKKLLRVEIRYKKMKKLNSVLKGTGLKVVTLADLTRIEVFQLVSSELLKVWSDAIYFNSLDEYARDSMTSQQLERFKYLLITETWNLGNAETEKEKAQIRSLRQNKKNTWWAMLLKFGGHNTQAEIRANMIGVLDQILGQKTAFEPHVLDQILDKQKTPVENEKLVRFTTLKIRGEKLYLENSIKEDSEVKTIGGGALKKSGTFYPRKADPKKHKCSQCGGDMSHKKPNAKYCSKRCSNKQSHENRKRRMKEAKTKEIPILENLLKKMERGRLNLLITYTHNRKRYSDLLEQKEIKASSDWIKRIKEVQVLKGGGRSKRVLTGTRAKKLIREITKRNN